VGKKWLSKDKAAKELMRLTEAGRSAAYNAMDKVKGRFADRLRVNQGNGEFSIYPKGTEDGDG
jgi:hypothetical protein